MNPEILSVGQFIAIVNETLDYAFPDVTIEGEISSYKINQGKFVFFDLKDETGVLNCFMMLYQVKLPLEDGMRVRVTGRAKVTKFSKFSLTVKNIEIAGEGALKRAMELLRKKLENEGLFAEARKRLLPKYPQRIGLITSATSAAYADFIKIINARWSGLDIILADVTVQGATAPDQICEALEQFNQLSPAVDVIALIRGGGSLEDLQAFSTEPVARAIASSRTPIIVGVGHEIDFSLADFAADVRAATPTDAARLIVPDKYEILAQINSRQYQISSRIDARIQQLNSTIAESIYGLDRYLTGPKERLRELQAALWLGLSRTEAEQARFEQAIRSYDARLRLSLNRVLSINHTTLTTQARLLQGYNPANILRRGYAIVRQNGHILYDSQAAKIDSSLMIQLSQGSIEATVKDIKDGKPEII